MLGGPGYVVIPGLIDAHQHGRGVTNIQRGVEDAPLERWLTRLRGLWPTDVYLTTAIAALRLMRSGVTTAMHHFASTGVVSFEDELAASLQAYRDVGIRVTFTLDFRNQHSYVYASDEEFLKGLPQHLASEVATKLPPRVLPNPSEILALLPKLRSDWDMTRIKFALGPQGLEWSSDSALNEIAAFSRSEDVPIHTHVLETKLQRESSFRSHGISAVARLAALGMLNEKSSLAHMVWASEEDLEIVRQSGSVIVHNPASNLRLKSGIAPVLAMLRKRIPVAIGMDGMSISDQGDFFQDLRLCQNLHFDETGALHSDDVWRMVLQNGGKATFWGDKVGSLKPGCWGDAVVLRLSDDAMVKPTDPSWNVMNRVMRESSPSSIHAVIVGGQLRIKDGSSTALDENDLMRHMREHAETINPEDMIERRNLVAQLEQAVARYYDQWRIDNARKPFYVMNRQ